MPCQLASTDWQSRARTIHAAGTIAWGWNRLETGQVNAVLRDIESNLDHLAAATYEDLCRQLVAIGGLGPNRFGRVGRWWNRSEEMDVVGFADDGGLLPGEAKWSTRHLPRPIPASGHPRRSPIRAGAAWKTARARHAARDRAGGHRLVPPMQPQGRGPAVGLKCRLGVIFPVILTSSWQRRSIPASWHRLRRASSCSDCADPARAPGPGRRFRTAAASTCSTKRSITSEALLDRPGRAPRRQAGVPSSHYTRTRAALRRLDRDAAPRVR